jgi:GT2 family glycosyltransferase
MGEEFFLAYQLKLQNLKLYYEPSIKVYHQDHASTGLIESHNFWKISRESHKIYKKYFKSYE